MSQTLPPHTYITKQDQFEHCIGLLHQSPQVAIDLEANGMFAYRESICLIQISTRELDFIVDPLSDIDLNSLGGVIEDPSIEKIFHAAEYDLILLRRAFEWQLNNLFDTMWAARILGHERVGLANMLNATFDVQLNKKYQRANWAQRPLTTPQLQYAQSDTHYLHDLRDRLYEELEAKGRVEEALEIFAEQTQVKLPDTDFRPEGFWTIDGVNDLLPHQQGILRELNILRDSISRRRDRPPFKVFSDKSMVDIAHIEPRHVNELYDVRNFNDRHVQRYGRAIINAVSAGKPKRPKRPRRVRRPDAVVSRYDRLREWRKHRAVARSVPSDVVLSRDSLWELAEQNPQSAEALAAIKSLGPWRRQKYGQEILELLG